MLLLNCIHYIQVYIVQSILMIYFIPYLVSISYPLKPMLQVAAIMTFLKCKSDYLKVLLNTSQWLPDYQDKNPKSLADAKV